MARPSKTLAERVRDRSFLARRHADLLAGPLVAPAGLRELQERWQEADSPAVRRALALEFARALTAADAETVRAPLDVRLPVAEFFARYLVHTKGPAAGEPFRLEPWQRTFVEEFTRTDEHDARVYKRGMLGVARGNGKSPTAAGLGLRELLVRDDSPDIFLAAAARDQARVVFEYAAGLVQAGPLVDVLRVGRHEIRNPLNGGVLRTISADGFVAHGLNPSAVIIDELHAWKTRKQTELFDALDTAIHKRPDAFWLVITTAGHELESLLGKLYRQMLDTLELDRSRPGLTVGTDPFNGVLLHWYGTDADADADDEGLWEAANPASFVSVGALRKQRRSPSMSASTFKRLHLNAFVPTEAERWLPGARWDELADPTLAAPEGAEIFVGADGSRSYDTTAVAWAWRDAADRVCVDARVFSVRAEVPHHVLHAGTIDFGDVEGFLLELASRFDVREVRFDPRYLERSMEVLAGRLSGAVAPVEPYSGAHRQALQTLERLVLDGTLRHRGDPALTEQVSWTACDRFDNGDVRRVRKLDRSRPIDAAVALSLAVRGAIADEATSVYASRGLVSV